MIEVVIFRIPHILDKSMWIEGDTKKVVSWTFLYGRWPLIKGPKHESFGFDFCTPSVTFLMKSTVHGRRKTKIPAQKGCHEYWYVTLVIRSVLSSQCAAVTTYHLQTKEVFKEQPRRQKIFNPFLFIKNKQLFISSEGFSTLEKNTLISH
jgi:hypothetical protein